jgi:hypothetical protein
MTATIDELLGDLAEQAAAAAKLRGVEAVSAWTDYAAAVRHAVNKVRALEVADMMYLDGLTFREIIDRLAKTSEDAVSHQAVSEWLKRHGPKEYATVRLGDHGYEVDWVLVVSLTQTRRELKAMQDVGRRVVPARWGITRDDKIDPELLWQRVGEK